jgi:hypothetical protein
VTVVIGGIPGRKQKREGVSLRAFRENDRSNAIYARSPAPSFRRNKQHLGFVTQKAASYFNMAGE